MSLSDGFTDIPPGKLAAIATVMEIPAPFPSGPIAGSARSRSGAALTMAGDEAIRPERLCLDLERYRDLLRRVGGDHLWYARLAEPEERIRAHLDDEQVEIHGLVLAGRPEAIAEIDFRETGTAELVYFGVTPELIGRGFTGALMSLVMARATARGVGRLWLHTNTHDHPRAMRFYRSWGFAPVRQMLELVDDPRLTGIFDRGAAPRIPVFGDEAET